MGEDQGFRGFLAKVETIERANPEKRVVSVTMPCDFPPEACNVEDLSTWMGLRVTLGGHAGMRQGVYGSFRVTKGPFSVRFNDGTTA